VKISAYQTIGWYPRILPDRRIVATLSDGGVFSTREGAESYAQTTGMCLREIRTIEVESDDPRIDHLLKAQSEESP
jgi:hypothetical protein